MMRVGVIGLGAFGEMHIQAYQSLPGVEVAAVCSRSERRAREIAARYRIPRWSTSWEDVAGWDGVDAVSITTAETEHLEPARIAARAGKHLLVEKPLAASSSEALEIVQVAAEAGVLLVPGHILRFTPPYAALKERVDGGELGDVVSIHAHRHRPASLFPNYARVHPAFVTLIHDVDIACWLVGSRPRRVKAAQRVVVADTPDAIWAWIEFECGALAHVESAWILPDEGGVTTDDGLKLLGSKGSATIEIGKGPLALRTTSGVAYPDVLYEAPSFGGRWGGLGAQLATFLQCVQKGRPCARVRPEDGVAAVRVVEAIVYSARIGEPVEVSEWQ